MAHYKTYIILLLISMYVNLCSQTALAQIAPEPASGIQQVSATTADNYMVVTAHPLASIAASHMINQGGNAIDAAIAAQMVLTIVEPQSSGIGGGGFLLYYDATNKRLTSYDGRETAPAGATPEMFLTKDGIPMPFMKAVRSGKAVGVPGVLAMLSKTHQAYGKLPWKTLFSPAIHIARDGFRISERMHISIEYAAQFQTSNSFKALYLTKDGQAKPAGTWLTNPLLADVLQNIAAKGPGYFYNSDLTISMADAVQSRGGSLTTADFQAYQAKERAPVCLAYRHYNICGMGPPSSGGITTLETLGILEHFTLNQPYAPGDIHLIMEAQKRAFADRNYYLADSDAVPVPSASQFLDSSYLKQRSQEISLQQASPTPVSHGNLAIDNGKDHSFDAPSTSHISIVDKTGSAVSFTSSVEHSFGSGIVVDGFVLNNQLTDFSFIPTTQGQAAANAVAPGKRPRSSMSPTMIFDKDGQLYAVLGSPGGSSIIPYVTKTIVALLDWKMPLQKAINGYHFMHKNTHATLENGLESLISPLQTMGYHPQLAKKTSGVNAILVNPYGKLIGTSDPRREGIAIGK